MQGVTVLNSINHYGLPPIFIGVAILLMVVVMAGIYFLITQKSKVITLSSAISIVICIIGMLGLMFYGASHKLYTSYECIVAKDVNFIDIDKHYNVISQRGEIWELTEK